MEERSLQTSQGEAGEHQALVPWMLRELQEGGMGGIKAHSQLSHADYAGGKAGLKRAGRNKRNCYFLLLFCCPFV